MQCNSLLSDVVHLVLLATVLVRDGDAGEEVRGRRLWPSRPLLGGDRGRGRRVYGGRVAVEGGLDEDDDLGARRDGAVVRRDAQPELVPLLEVLPQRLLERDRAVQLTPDVTNESSVKLNLVLTL